MRIHSIRMACLMFFSLVALPAGALAAGPKGSMYRFTVPKQGSMYADGTYYCWLPESTTAVRCVIVHHHGCTREGDAQQVVNDVQWLTLVKKWRAVFVVPSMVTGAPGSGSSQCNNWFDINNGSGNVFLAALDTLASRCGHPEIRTIPWALWGHSGGSLWITAMTGKYPDRVAVAVAEAGSVEMANVPGALKVPILHHNGKKDMIYNDVQFANGRAKGALWAHAINPNLLWVNGPTPAQSGWSTEVYGHAPHDLRMIAIPWIDICLESRLPDQAGQSLLKSMDTSGAWYGDTGTRTITSAASFTGNKTAACWFPNRYCAQKWKEYMASGTLNDSTPPPAPYDLAGTYGNKQIALKWDADADLETGIKTFVIYRNGTVLTTLQYTTTTLFTASKGFQRWDDGDNANPSPAPAMTFTDNTVTDTGTYLYQVSTVNWSDFAGEKSAALALKRGLVTSVSTAKAQVFLMPRKSGFLSLTGGRTMLRCAPGRFDLYDIRGRLLRTAVVTKEGIVEMKVPAGSTANNLVVLRKRGP
jgi:hypothetical protein